MKKSSSKKLVNSSARNLKNQKKKAVKVVAKKATKKVIAKVQAKKAIKQTTKQTIKKTVKKIKVTTRVKVKKITAKKKIAVKKVKEIKKQTSKVLAKGKKVQNRIAETIIKTKKQTEARRIEKLVMDNRESAKKMGYSLLKRWNVRIEKDEINSVIDYALCDAAMRYIPNKGASFVTYFFYHLRGHLVRLITDLTMAGNLFARSEINGDLDYEGDTAGRMQLENPIYSKSELIESPETVVIKNEDLNLCSLSLRDLDRLEREVLLKTSNDENVIDVAKEFGYSRCHISRIKKDALSKLKAIYGRKSTVAFENLVFIDEFKKHSKSRNKNKMLSKEVAMLTYNA